MVLGNGDGTFQAPVDFSTGALSTPEALAATDFNNDGNLDIVATNQHDHGVAVLLGNGDGTFQAPQIISLDNTPGAVAVGDLNGDGLDDVVTTHAGPSPFVSVLFNEGAVPTAVALAPSVAQGQAGVQVTFTVAVIPVAPGTGTPTGTVTLFDGDTVLGTAPLDANGRAVFTFAFDVGDHSLTVSYGDDGNFQARVSDPLALSVI